jgi:hypothetical protein
MGLKFTYSFNDLYENQKDKLQCGDKHKNEIWKDEIAGHKKAYLSYKDELTKSHKVSSGDLSDLNVEEAYYISESEICVKLDRAIKEKEDCYHPIDYSNKLKATDMFSMTFEETCKKLSPEIIRRIQVCKYKN